MQTALDLLAEAGRIGLVYFWQPVLIWSVLALLVSSMLERWADGHPLIKYRIYQALLFALPLGVLASAVTDFSILSFLRPSTGTVEIGPLSAWVLDTEHVQQGIGVGYLIQIVAGLLSAAALLAVIVRGIKLIDQAASLAAFRQDISPQSAHEVLGAEAVRRIEWTAPYRDVRIAVVSEPVVPMTFGVFHPIMVLPASLFTNPAGLRMAVAHELVHIRRCDALQHWLEEGIETAFAAWPVVRSVRRQIRIYREVSCDLEVLGEPSFSRKAYAQLLGSFSLGSAPKVAASLGMAAPSNELKQRITAMKNDAFRTISNSQLLRASLGGAAAMLFTILLIMSCTDLVGMDDTATESELTPSTSSASAASTEEVFMVVDQQPQFPGGMQALAAFLQNEIRYPDIARKAGVEGKVFIQFVVGSDGKISGVEVVRGIGGGCDEEAIRVVKAMPDWIPGRQNGHNVAVRFSMPITFKLNA